MNRNHAAMMGQTFAGQRPYSAAEIWADGAAHVAGVVAGLIGSILLLAHVAPRQPHWQAVAIYLLCLLAMLSFSAAYNLWPLSPVKWWLRRFDHSAIFLLIAGTYTPLLPFLTNRTEALALALFLWFGAAFGMAVKFLLPGRFDTLAVGAYLALGWAGVLSAWSFHAVLPGPTQVLIVIGGLLYSAGVVFHLWQRLKFQNAIWHGFVVAAAACHFAAIAYAYA